MDSLFIGLFIVIVAAILQGSFAVPMSYARTWKWENSWLMFSIFGMIVLNIIFALIAIPNLGTIYQSASLDELLIPLVFGFFFGLSAITFGLGIVTVGFALGYPMMLGLGLAFGTSVPMIVLHPGDILTFKGMLVVISIFVTLFGIGTTALAGMRREREQEKPTGEIARDARYSFKVGILFCFINGLCASAINIGFALSGSLLETARSLGAPELWAGNAVWALLFSVGGVVNIAYCAYLLRANKTTDAFVGAGSLKNFAFIILMSLMWIGSFILYGVGAIMMGSWGTVIGWSVYLILSIALGNFWGMIQGEWHGTSRKTRLVMVRGIVILIVAIGIFAYSGTL